MNDARAAAERTLIFCDEGATYTDDSKPVELSVFQVNDLIAVRDAYLSLLNNPAAHAAELANGLEWQLAMGGDKIAFTEFGSYVVTPTGCWSLQYGGAMVQGGSKGGESAATADYQNRVASLLRSKNA